MFDPLPHLGEALPRGGVGWRAHQEYVQDNIYISAVGNLKKSVLMKECLSRFHVMSCCY